MWNCGLSKGTQATLKKAKLFVPQKGHVICPSKRSSCFLSIKNVIHPLKSPCYFSESRVSQKDLNSIVCTSVLAKHIETAVNSVNAPKSVVVSFKPRSTKCRWVTIYHQLLTRNLQESVAMAKHKIMSHLCTLHCILSLCRRCLSEVNFTKGY